MKKTAPSNRERSFFVALFELPVAWGAVFFVDTPCAVKCVAWMKPIPKKFDRQATPDGRNPGHGLTAVPTPDYAALDAHGAVGFGGGGFIRATVQRRFLWCTVG